MPPRQRLLICNEEEEFVGDRDGGDSPPPPPHPPPPQMLDMAQFWANATQFMTSMMATMLRQGEHHEIVGCSLTNFFRHNSSVFDGSAGPLATDNWISNF
jgi:hypothetical protein